MDEIEIETEFAVFYYDANLLKAIYKENANISIKAATEIVDKRILITQNKMHKLLIIVPKKINMTKEARDYLSGEYGIKNIIASAIVVTSKYSNFLTKLFIKIIKPPMPTKIFSNEEKAIQWLQTL